MKLNIDPIIEKVKSAVSAHKMSDGGYARYLPRMGKESMESNVYGCADAANLFYTINEMPKGVEKKALSDAIKSFQEKESGLFRELSHHPYHCTAHCIASLELFDELPLYPVTEMEKYENPAVISGWLDTVDSAHVGAGVFSALFLTGKMTLDWQNEFFSYFDSNIDEKYGMCRKGSIDSKKHPRWLYMGDWFHYLFCYYACRRAFPLADRLVDTCIEMYKSGEMPESFGRGQRFLDIDWAFSINRGSLQSGYRIEEARELLRDFAKGFTDYLKASPLSEPQWSDMHLMFGSVCALSELQTALPGELLSTRPLRQILDRRPFI